MEIYLGVVSFLVGSVVGSFLNVVIHRLPRRLSVVFPPSSCPGCGERIRAVDNIPIVSFLLLRGKCRSCGGKISPRYPAVELLTALCTLALVLLLGLSVPLAVYLPLTWALIALAFIDAEHQILPDRITYPGIAFSILVPILGSLESVSWEGTPGPLGWGNWAAGIILGGAVPYLVGQAYRVSQFRKPSGERLDGMGMGDVKMLAMVGGFLGWKLVLLTILIGSVLGSLWGLGGVALSRYGMKHALPFGTFLAVAAFVSLTAGPALVAWYVSLLGFVG